MTERPYKNVERKYLVALCDIFSNEMRRVCMLGNEEESEKWFYLFSQVADELKIRLEEDRFMKKQITIEEYMRSRKNE